MMSAVRVQENRAICTDTLGAGACSGVLCNSGKKQGCKRISFYSFPEPVFPYLYLGMIVPVFQESSE